MIKWKYTLVVWLGLASAVLAQDTKLSALGSINGSDVAASSDLLYIVDASAGLTGSKKITVNELLKAIGTGARQVDQMRYVPATGGDDLATLQAALTAATDGTVIVLHGSYSVSDGLTLSANGVTIAGLGATITQTGSLKKTISVTGDRVTIRGVHFVGLGTETPWGGTTWNGVCGVYVNAADDVEVSDCRFTNHAGGAVDFYGVCARCKVLRNTMIGMGSGSITSGGNGADGAIGMSGTTTAKNGLLIAHNDISGHAHGIFSGTGAPMIISDNLIHDIPGQHGIYNVEGGDLTVSGNTLTDIEENCIKLQHQTATDYYCTVNIIGNTCARSGQACISIGPAGAGVGYYTHNATIIANNIYDVQYGIYVRGAKNVLVASNRINTCSLYGMYLYDWEGDVVGNRIANSEQSALYCYGPEDSARISDLEIVDSPVNVDAGVNPLDRCAFYFADAASPNNEGIAYIGNIHVSYQHISPPANLQYCMNMDANAQVIARGEIVNLLTVGHYATANFDQYQRVDNTGAAPTNVANACFMYSSDVSAGRASPHFMTEEGHVIKLFRGTAIADVPTGGSATAAANATAINSILARLRVTGGSGQIAD